MFIAFRATSTCQLCNYIFTSGNTFNLHYSTSEASAAACLVEARFCLAWRSHAQGTSEGSINSLASLDISYHLSLGGSASLPHEKAHNMKNIQQHEGK